MSEKQGKAWWELCRAGLPLLADAAQQCWQQGKKFELRNDIQVRGSLRALLKQANWEAERQTQ
jgi:hypothetical protein